MKKLKYAALLVVSALVLSACGPSVESLCTENARARKRVAELTAMGFSNPQNFDKAEFEKAGDDWTESEKKLESKGGSRAACPKNSED